MEVRSPKWISLRLNQGVGKAALLSGGSAGEFIPLPFPVSGGPQYLAHILTFPLFKASNIAPLIFIINFPLTTARNSSVSKD